MMAPWWKVMVRRMLHPGDASAAPPGCTFGGGRSLLGAPPPLRVPASSSEVPGRGELLSRIEALTARVQGVEAERDRLREQAGALREARAAAERASEAKGRLLATMSHELRTPLMGVIAYSEMLEGEVYGPVAEQQQAVLARIRANSWHLVSIIEEVLTLSRAEAGRLEVAVEETDLAEIAREVVGMVEAEGRRRGLGLRFAQVGERASLRTDPGKVRQILLNLVGNALKYTERGEVTVEVDGSAPGRLQVHVRDTGPGIAPGDRERIFEPYTQVDGGRGRTACGTGLGLAISRTLARLLGGDTTLESAPGTGSTFTLWLPRRRSEG